MADNVVLNSGSGGATLSTDEVTRATVVQHVQYVKLMNGTDGAIDVIPGEATNGLDVDVTRVQGSVTVAQATAANLQVTVGAALPAGTNNIGDVDVLTVPAPLNLTGGGVEASALRVTLANDSTGLISVDDNGGSLTVDGTVTANLAAGTNNIGDVDVLTLPSIPAGTNNIGDVDVLTLPAIPAGTNSIGRVNPEPQTANGLSVSRTISAASTNATSAKGSAGQVYTVIAHNINAAVRYLKLYNKDTAPTVGTDTPLLTLPIPGNTAGAGFVLDTGGMGIAFSLGIGYAITTGVADADTGAVAANEIVVNVLYK